MNQIELKNQIDVIAWGPRGTQELREAASHPSPVVACVGAFNHFQTRSDLDDHETELLRHACRLIRTNHWFGLVAEAVEVEASLPPPPPPPQPPTPPVAIMETQEIDAADVINLPINISDE